jgi:hypothetical protein
MSPDARPSDAQRQAPPAAGSHPGAPLPLVVALCLMAVLPAAGSVVAPEGATTPVWLEVSGSIYGYFPLTADAPLAFDIEGPVTFEPILRWRFEEGASTPDVDVEFIVDGTQRWHQVFRPGVARATYADFPTAKAGTAIKVPIGIPKGAHSVDIVLRAPDVGTLDINPVVRPPAVLPYRIEWRLEAGAAYDSNIFRYSDSDVDDFLDGLHGDRYQAEYLDDLRLEPSVDVSLVRERPGRSETAVTLSADGRIATVNTEKSFAVLGARVKESYDGLGYGLFRFYVIPRYQIRKLWDPDVTSGDPYRDCEFRKQSMGFELGTDGVLPIDAVVRVKLDDYAYNQDFVEYDSDAVSWGLVAIARPVRGVRVDAGYTLRRLEARGYDEVVEEHGVSDDSDISYDQDEFTLKVRWDVGRVLDRRTALTFRARLASRYYQTEKSIEDDPYHAGREDTYWTLSARSDIRLSERTTLQAFAEHFRRTSDSDRLEELGVDKDYTAYRIGLRLIFEGELNLD